MPIIHKLHLNKSGLRVSIPATFARALGWLAGDEVIIFITEDKKVVVEKITPEKHAVLFDSSVEAIIDYDRQ